MTQQPRTLTHRPLRNIALIPIVDSGNATVRGVLLHGKWIMSYNRLLDYLEVVKAIHVSFFDASNYALIRRIHQLLADIGVWGMQQISREFNKIANCMGKMDFNTGQNLKVFEEIPREVLAITLVVKANDSFTQSLYV
ncbi:hypothetical protein CXB51_033900 [Gossypium anomalum]|uniref:RNase H type-1 domain-containing protein n=1 Tax=Gossypium anomalum TaxID=47600 RepID=A0A8J6CK99_9ROSI|nr:hypothetical protein CXB51_033900 [Gossypium anomalum]